MIHIANERTQNITLIAASAVLVAALLAFNMAYAQEQQAATSSATAATAATQAQQVQQLGQEIQQGRAERLVALVGSVVALGGTVAAVVIAVINKLRTSGIIKEGQNKILDEVYNGAKGIKESDFWTLENQKRLTTFIEVATALSPELKQKLEEKGVAIDKLKADLDNTTAEIEKLHGAVPA